MTRADGSPLPPRVYSNGVSQDEAVRRIVSAFRRARAQERPADVFFHAGTGSGKSIVALLAASKVGRAIVVIPTVNLQSQYEADYQGDGGIRVPRPDGRPLRLASVKGRSRYECPHEGGTAADPHVCNKSVKDAGARWRTACSCPRWSPILPKEAYEALARVRPDPTDPQLEERHREFLRCAAEGAREYRGIDDDFVHLGARGCPYFDAHGAYADADVILLNNRKWEIETGLGRKPRVDLEVFDEADAFLDSLFDEERLTRESLEHLFRRVDYPAKVLTLRESLLRDPARAAEVEADAELLPEEHRAAFKALRTLVLRLKTFESPSDFSDDRTWLALESAPKLVKELSRLALERLHTEFQLHPWATLYVQGILSLKGGGTDAEESVLGKIKELVDARDSLFLAYDREGVYFTYASFARPLRGLLARSAPLRLWMSATLPSREILERVYGFKDPVIVEGEPRFQGTIRVARTAPAPPKVTAKTWVEPQVRHAFVRGLDGVFAAIPRHERAITIVFGQGRLVECQHLSENVRWLVREIERDALEHEARLAAFFEGGEGAPRHLVSTRIVRGVDFRGDKCRNIVLLKDPIPNLKSSKFQALEKRWPPGLFMAYAQDAADRTLAQMLGRGVRAPDDWVRVWCLDSALYARIARITEARARVEWEDRALPEVPSTAIPLDPASPGASGGGIAAPARGIGGDGAKEKPRRAGGSGGRRERSRGRVRG